MDEQMQHHTTLQEALMEAETKLLRRFPRQGQLTISRVALAALVEAAWQYEPLRRFADVAEEWALSADPKGPNGKLVYAFQRLREPGCGSGRISLESAYCASSFVFEPRPLSDIPLLKAPTVPGLRFPLRTAP